MMQLCDFNIKQWEDVFFLLFPRKKSRKILLNEVVTQKIIPG